jgi:KDO2-lipid IV(A) lauroyltransferase
VFWNYIATQKILDMPKFRWYYIIITAPLFLLSLLPMWVLFGISDFVRFLIYHVFGYRKKVVFENLRNSFPEKSEEWIEKTAWAFYRNLFDVTIETIKMASVRKSFYNKHLKQEGLEIIHALNKKNQPFILVCGHAANWEWAGQTLQQSSSQVDVLYHPLTSKWFDWFMYHIRTRFGVYPMAMNNSLREMIARKNIPSAITFIADQTPSSTNCHWMNFLNQDTPVFLGVEKLAKRFNYPIVFGEAYRTKRGYYDVKFWMMCEEPNKTAEFEITEMHTRALEKQIIKQPELWLWSHRRWKHKRN